MRNAAVPSFAFQPDTAIFTDTILSVQWLRGLAALIVVLFHLELAPWGASGVDVFFVISGFIMWRTTQHKDMHPATFYRHRIWRIVPIYWIYTLLLVLAFFAVPSAFSRLQFDWAHLATSFFFIPWQSPTSGLATPFLVQGWSLNYEMFFYLIFGATLALASHLRLATITCLLSGLVVLGCLVEPTSTAGRVYLDPLLLEFLAGVWVAQFWRRHAAYLSEPLAGLAIVAAFTSLIISTPLASTISGWQRVAVWGAPSVLLLVGALSLSSPTSRACQHLVGF